ncbi:MAG: hypothetical protein WDN75_04630 [Bacteroidota bacterium]
MSSGLGVIRRERIRDPAEVISRIVQHPESVYPSFVGDLLQCYYCEDCTVLVLWLTVSTQIRKVVVSNPVNGLKVE